MKMLLSLFFIAGFSTIYAPSILPIKLDHCGPVCAIYCSFGNVLDEHGCPTCRCNQEPVVQVLGTKPSPLGAMSSCQPVHCRIFCPNGWKVDPTTGCEYCACKEI